MLMRNGRIELKTSDGRKVVAVRKTAKDPWEVEDPWGTWTMRATRGEIICDMNKRIAVFESVEREQHCAS